MDCLLDTHTLIWFLNGDKDLSDNALKLINDPGNNKYISIVSVWEIAIKIALEKLIFDGGTSELIELIYNNNFEILPITEEHTIEYERLEFIHRDPFDRMLIVQSKVERLTIITRDSNIHSYNVRVKW